MARINYPEIVQKTLKSYASYYGNDPEIKLVFDTNNNHYLMLNIGWRKHDRVWGCIVHITIENGKIWIQRDGTEDGITNELIDAGVPKSDIVLGFKSPSMRKDIAEYAMG